MSNEIEEIKQLFPSSKEIEIAGKKLFVKPMVWTDFLKVIDSFGKVMAELSKNSDFDLEKFDEKKDLAKLIPVIEEVLNIFAKWLNVELIWLKDNLTMKGTMQLLTEFLEVNEWDDIKSLFLALKLKVQKKTQEK